MGRRVRDSESRRPPGRVTESSSVSGKEFTWAALVGKGISSRGKSMRKVIYSEKSSDLFA